MFKFNNGKQFIWNIVVFGLISIILLILCEIPAIQARPIWHIFFRTLGISMFVALFLTILWNYRLEKYFLEEIAQYLRLSIAINIIGISDFYPDRDAASHSIKECLNNCRSELKLLGGSLTYFFSANAIFELKELIKKNLTNDKFSIKILLPDDKYPGTNNRTKVNGLSNIDTLRGCLKVAKDLKNIYPTVVDVHKFQIDPMCFLIVTKDEMFLEPYDFSGHGWSAPVFKSQGNSSLYKRYNKHFDYIWNAKELSTELPLKNNSVER